MHPVIEVRTYQARPGMRDALFDILRSEAFPLQRGWGMKVLGPFPSLTDDVTFVWLRGFPDEASRTSLTSAFYDSDAWREDLGPRVLPMLDSYSAVVITDTLDLWSDGPVERAGFDRVPASTPKMTFALTTVHGPAWDHFRGIREQHGWLDHAAFMDGLVETGFILVGGPLGDGAETLHVVTAENESHVRQRFSEDPWARDDLLQVSSIRPWSLWLDFRTAGPGHQLEAEPTRLPRKNHRTLGD